MKSLFVCQSCGNEFAKWSGQCSACKEWNSLVEAPTSPRNQKSKIKYQKSKGAGDSVSLSSPTLVTDYKLLVSTGLAEFDHVLSGGLIPGQVVLLSGEPGIGKSTLLLQVADLLGNRQQAIGSSQKDLVPNHLVPSASVLYVCGEESVSQIKIRADRLKISGQNIQLITETDVDALVETIDKGQLTIDKEESLKASKVDGQRSKVKCQMLIVDSIQTLTTADLGASAGSVAQVKECTARLIQAVKEKGIATILVGHVNKEGDIAGPKVLEHMVDTVLYFEGERTGQLRLLRTIKNRFGEVGETGVFEMGEQGFQSVSNASLIFASGKASGPGSVLTVTLEGTRPLVLEVQALTAKTAFNYPRRTATGFDLNRLYFLAAVLEKHLKIPLSSLDIYVNVTAGVIINEPAADLAVALAIVSSFKNLPLETGTVVYGELGLSGEVRPVGFESRRQKEAAKLGFKKIIGPATAKTLAEAVRQASPS